MESQVIVSVYGPNQELVPRHPTIIRHTKRSAQADINSTTERRNHMEQTTLYFREGSSDKVYQATLEPQDGGYVVNFAYGRRGATMQTGTKAVTAVNLDAARAIYEK